MNVASLADHANAMLTVIAQDLDTPQGKAEQSAKSKGLEGDDAALVSALKDALARAKQKVVILAGDRQVVLGEVVRVLALAKEAGASGFALASE